MPNKRQRRREHPEADPASKFPSAFVNHDKETRLTHVVQTSITSVPSLIATHGEQPAPPPAPAIIPAPAPPPSTIDPSALYHADWASSTEAQPFIPTISRTIGPAQIYQSTSAPPQRHPVTPSGLVDSSFQFRFETTSALPDPPRELSFVYCFGGGPDTVSASLYQRNQVPARRSVPTTSTRATLPSQPVAPASILPSQSMAPTPRFPSEIVSSAMPLSSRARTTVPARPVPPPLAQATAPVPSSSLSLNRSCQDQRSLVGSPPGSLHEAISPSRRPSQARESRSPAPPPQPAPRRVPFKYVIIEDELFTGIVDDGLLPTTVHGYLGLIRAIFNFLNAYGEGTMHAIHSLRLVDFLTHCRDMARQSCAVALKSQVELMYMYGHFRYVDLGLPEKDVIYAMREAVGGNLDELLMGNLRATERLLAETVLRGLQILEGKMRLEEMPARLRR